MKRNYLIITLLCLMHANCQCQLLSKPSLTVEDFENSLTNKSRLNKILRKHDFKYSATGAQNFSAPASLRNPLMPDLRTLMSEQWVLAGKDNRIFMKIDIDAWEPARGPHPDVIKTISLMVNRNSEYSAGLEQFLEIIRAKYPEERQRFYGNTDQYQPYREVINIFANSSKIEVRTGTSDTSYGQFYTVSFDLVR